jgi:hypothetical protein
MKNSIKCHENFYLIIQNTKNASMLLSMKKLKNEKTQRSVAKNYWKKLKGRSDNARLNKKQKI